MGEHVEGFLTPTRRLIHGAELNHRLGAALVDAVGPLQRDRGGALIGLHHRDGLVEVLDPLGLPEEVDVEHVPGVDLLRAVEHLVRVLVIIELDIGLTCLEIRLRVGRVDGDGGLRLLNGPLEITLSQEEGRSVRLLRVPGRRAFRESQYPGGQVLVGDSLRLDRRRSRSTRTSLQD